MTEATDVNAAEAKPAAVEAVKEEEVVLAEPVKQTRSVVLSGFGGPKYVRVQSKDQRVVGKGEIAVEIDACGISFLDVMTRQGLLESLGKPPFVMGNECSGKISEIGEGVTDHKVGEEVIVICDGGAWTECLVVTPFQAPDSSLPVTTTAPTVENEEHEKTEVIAKSEPSAPQALVLKKPAKLSFNQSAVAAMAYLPAYLLLHKVACVRDGDVVLVHSAGGGIGTALGQLAKLMSNVKLIGTASAAKHEKLGSLYAQLINHSQDYVAEVKKEHPQGIQVVLDCRAGEDTSKAISLLKSMGRYIVYGSSNFVTGDRKNLFSFAKSWIQMDRISPLKLLEENKVLGGFALKPMIFKQHDSRNVILDAWKELTNLFGQGKLEPIVDSEWSFEEVKEAMQKLQDRGNFGKVVISPKLKPKVPEPEVKAKAPTVDEKDKDKAAEEPPTN